MQDVSWAKQRNRLVEFMNSRGTGVTSGVDLLNDQLSAARVLGPFVADGEDGSLTVKVSAEVRKLRKALSEVVANPRNRGAWASLNRLAERVQFTVRLQSGKRTELAPRSGNKLVASILKDVAEAMDRGEWERFKQCARDDCSSTFFDATRSKTQRWCPYANCGNLMNVAAFRARMK